MKHNSKLRDELLKFLHGGHAHAEFDRAVSGLPANLQGTKAPNQPHTPWRLLEHMRIAQRDILDFSKDARHKSPSWPDEYWPPHDAPPDDSAWEKSVEQFLADRREMLALIANPTTDLLAPLPHGQGQTLLREALLVINHTAYHLGQLILLRRLLGLER